jgi:concentrative nucleoside transporter, CNT family
MIATYALCGYGNLGSIGIQAAIFSTLAPKREKFVNKFILKAMIGGTISSFMNACIAGIYI